MGREHLKKKGRLEKKNERRERKRREKEEETKLESIILEEKKDLLHSKDLNHHKIPLKV